MNHEKSTKNTERYAETVEYGETAVVGTIYLQKSTFKETGAAPAKINLKIDW